MTMKDEKGLSWREMQDRVDEIEIFPEILGLLLTARYQLNVVLEVRHPSKFLLAMRKADWCLRKIESILEAGALTKTKPFGSRRRLRAVSIP